MIVGASDLVQIRRLQSAIDRHIYREVAMKRFIKFLSISLLAVHVASDAYAYDDLSINQIWDRFIQNCEKVIEQPSEYINSLTVPSEYGARVLSKSDDGKSVSIYNRIENSYDQILLQRIAGTEIRDCSVYGEYYNKDPDRIADEFRSFIKHELGLNITGGHTPQEFYDESARYDHNGYFVFSISGAWPGKDWIARGHVVERELQLFIQAAVEID